jgi:hypothetical protein
MTPPECARPAQGRFPELASTLPHR